MTPERPWPEVYVALGSNVGDRMGYMETALRSMQESGIGILACSSVYETDPVGPAQGDYLNAVCLVETELSPEALLGALKEIEERTGRLPRERWGPREIDLDILLYGDRIIRSPELTVPHPEILNRSFVLVPLSEIAPDLNLPGDIPLSVDQEGAPGGIRQTSFRLVPDTNRL